MFGKKLYLILFLRIFQVSHCRRRIQGGGYTQSAKNYAVYLVMAPDSTQNYDAWLCGGALVTLQFILSSAACVIDVDFMYAIAGYKDNISGGNIENDECTKNKKKKIIYRCYPKKYELRYDELDYWAYIDIALVKVESPYLPNDVSFQIACSYIPQPIVINFEKKFQEPGTDAIVLGWGHDVVWRKEGDLGNYNEDFLKYTPILIKDKELCLKEYRIYPNMSSVIDEYMICASGKGNLDENGKLIETNLPTADGCAKIKALKGFVDENCEETLRRQISMENTHLKSNKSNNDSAMDIPAPDNYNNTSPKSTMRNFRRTESGICQNDHGGPLVTWKGGREVLIGVASVFKVNNASECIGPYLFTSTFCTANFIDCVLKYDKKQNRKNKKKLRSGNMELMCDAPASVRGFETIESHISWKKHPAGPADNEKAREYIKKNKENNNADRFAVRKQKMYTESYAEIAKKKYLEMQRKAALKRQAAMGR